jgi:Flp pilus assembly pilin Flp
MTSVEDRMLRTKINRFLANEEGAVTVDWVVLTAAIVGMVVAVFGIITRQSVTVGANTVDSSLRNAAAYSPGFGTWTRSGSGNSQADNTPPGG